MGAIASLISNGKDGFLFKTNDVDALIDKINFLIKNYDLRNELGINGYNKVMGNFTWPVIISKYREAYLTGIENFKQIIRNRI